MYRNILVPADLDDPKSCSETLAVATSLAKCFGAKISICSVVSNVEAITAGEWLPISFEQRLFDARARLEGLAAKAEGGTEFGVEVAAGTISGGILEIAKRISADLIVLESHQPVSRNHIFAAQAIRVARRASCSVFIARHGRG